MNQGPAPTPPAAQRRGDRRLAHRGGSARPRAVDLGDRRDAAPGEILLGVRSPARRSEENVSPFSALEAFSVPRANVIVHVDLRSSVECRNESGIGPSPRNAGGTT